MDNNDFIVSTEYAGYVFVGWACGRYEDQRSHEMKPFANMYVISPSSDYVSEDFEAFGFKAEKKKCMGPDVWKELQIGDRVKLFFDDKQRVVMAVQDN